MMKVVTQCVLWTVRCSLALPLLILIACVPEKPHCPFEGAPEFAPSAGCLAVVDDRILLVQTYAGGMSPPGGKSIAGESAQCTAHRETWEETGLDLKPVERLAVFDTGFHLYHCEYHRNYDALNVWPAEVLRALWLPVADLDRVEWRFPGQGQALQQIIPE